MVNIQGSPLPRLGVMNPNTEEVRRPAWMNTELLDKLKHKTEAYGRWKQGQAALEEYTEVVQAARDQVRTAKVLIESNVFRKPRTKRKASIRRSVIKGRLWKMWACSKKKWESWLPRTLRRLRYAVTLLSQSHLPASAPAEPPKW